MSLADPIAKSALPPFKRFPQKGPDVSVDRRDDGCVYIRSNHAMAEPARSIAHLFAERAVEHADRNLLMQREPGHGAWRGVTYAQTRRDAAGIAQWLLARGMGQGDAVLILSVNSVEQVVVMLGCYTAGCRAQRSARRTASCPPTMPSCATPSRRSARKWCSRNPPPPSPARSKRCVRSIPISSSS